MPSVRESAETFLRRISDFYDVDPEVRRFRNIAAPRARERTLAWYERQGNKEFMYRIALGLRREWGLLLERDVQAAITWGFIDRNLSNWDGVDARWQQLIWEFFVSETSGVKDAIRQVEINLHKQWEEGQSVVEGLIGGYSSQAFGGIIDGLAGEMGLAGVRHDQPQTEKIARLMDPYPYLVATGAFEIGRQMCEAEGIPIETGVTWGIKFGFIKRNTVDFYKEWSKTPQKEELFHWFKDEARIDQALGILVEDLEVAWAFAGAKKLA